MARAVGGSGKFEIVYGFLKSISIGETKIKNIPVYIRKFHDEGSRVDGYIGLSLISKFLTTVDYGNSTFILAKKNQAALQPPSIGMAEPVMSAPAVLHSKATSAATLSGATNLPEGWRVARNARSASARVTPVLARSASSRLSMFGVGIVPGHTALQVMFVRAVSRATARVKPMRRQEACGCVGFGKVAQHHPGRRNAPARPAARPVRIRSGGRGRGGERASSS